MTCGYAPGVPSALLHPVDAARQEPATLTSGQASGASASPAELPSQDQRWIRADSASCLPSLQVRPRNADFAMALGANPATEIRFGSSKTAVSLWETRIYRMPLSAEPM